MQFSLHLNYLILTYNRQHNQDIYTYDQLKGILKFIPHWSTGLHVRQEGVVAFLKSNVALFQLLKKFSRVLYNIVVLFIPWEVRIKKIESESLTIMNEVIVDLIVALWKNDWYTVIRKVAGQRRAEPTDWSFCNLPICLQSCCVSCSAHVWKWWLLTLYYGCTFPLSLCHLYASPTEVLFLFPFLEVTLDQV